MITSLVCVCVCGSDPTIVLSPTPAPPYLHTNHMSSDTSTHTHTHTHLITACTAASAPFTQSVGEGLQSTTAAAAVSNNVYIYSDRST